MDQLRVSIQKINSSDIETKQVTCLDKITKLYFHKTNNVTNFTMLIFDFFGAFNFFRQPRRSTDTIIRFYFLY